MPFAANFPVLNVAGGIGLFFACATAPVAVVVEAVADLVAAGAGGAWRDTTGDAVADRDGMPRATSSAWPAGAAITSASPLIAACTRAQADGVCSGEVFTDPQSSRRSGSDAPARAGAFCGPFSLVVMSSAFFPRPLPLRFGTLAPPLP
jgi:hypothetical protein